MRYLSTSMLVLFCCLGACREQRVPTSSAAASADGAKADEPAPSTRPAVPLRTYGELRAMMHEGKVGPAVNLRTVLRPGAFALGALSELRGEVTILNGEAWLGYPGEGDATRVEKTSSSTEDAALLVSVDVAKWRDVSIPSDIPWAKLDEQLEALAKQAGIDTEQPFPFLIEGELADVKWHVIDGRRAAPGPSSHEQHQKMAAKGTETNVNATLLGFFSKQHQGIFTHHGENSHLHFVDPVKKLTGHVDGVNIKRGAKLRVPE